MQVTVDGVGRIVIPKRLRDALGITTDTLLEIVPDGAGLRLDPVVKKARRVEVQDGLPILDRVHGLVLTDEDVLQLRDDLNR
jgi:AbrB family looped-hinge helix DNA binding protein